MRTYGLFYVDQGGAFGHVQIACETDQECIGIIQVTPFRGTAEVWEGARFVALISPGGKVELSPS